MCVLVDMIYCEGCSEAREGLASAKPAGSVMQSIFLS